MLTLYRSVDLCSGGKIPDFFSQSGGRPIAAPGSPRGKIRGSSVRHCKAIQPARRQRRCWICHGCRRAPPRYTKAVTEAKAESPLGQPPSRACKTARLSGAGPNNCGSGASSWRSFYTLGRDGGSFESRTWQAGRFSKECSSCPSTFSDRGRRRRRGCRPRAQYGRPCDGCAGDF